MNTVLLNGPEIPPASGTVKRLVIFLHGLGSNGDDLISLAELMELPDTQYLSPNAPFDFEMADFGYQWFSLTDRNPKLMLEGALVAAPSLNYYIDAQLKRFNLTDKDVALVGFSQGTMMAMFTGLRRAQPLAGIVGFSGMLLAPELLSRDIVSRPPICLIHGAQDAVVPFLAMEYAEAALEAHDVYVETHARPMLGHSIDERGLEAATAFLKKQFGV